MKICGLALACAAALSAQQAKHVVVFGVDGLAPSAVAANRTPNMQKLMAIGAWTLHARAILPTVSAPNWSAMIMGTAPDFSGVTSNDWRPGKFEIAPFCHDGAFHPPTVFGAIRKARPQAGAALFTDWPGFIPLVEPDGPSKVSVAENDAGKTVREAIAYFASERPALLFIHVDNVDHAGHGSGWYTEAYHKAVSEADALLGDVIAAVDRSGMRNETILLVTADHGGHDTKHGGMLQSDIEIPWIAAGPGLKTGEIRAPLSTTQTGPSIAAWLGVPADGCWIARAVGR
jgi:predicted AlkP superfamily pyrophosphatase or phosphodiesterase